MEFLVFLMILVFVAVSGNNKKKKAQSAGKGAPAADRRRAALSKQLTEAKRGQDYLKAFAAMAVDPAGDAPSATQKPPAGAQAAAPSPPTLPRAAVTEGPPQGNSPLDEEGCVGGSMAHTHDEGESREEHSRHQAAVNRRETEETLAAMAAKELADMNVHRLRRAVVVSEILDRPKALRRRAS